MSQGRSIEAQSLGGRGFKCSDSLEINSKETWG